MSEKIHEVTWYSKLLSVAAVGVVAVSGFWMGQAFQAEEQQQLTAMAFSGLRPVSERMVQVPEINPEMQLQEILDVLEITNEDAKSIFDIAFKLEEVEVVLDEEITAEETEESIAQQ